MSSVDLYVSEKDDEIAGIMQRVRDAIESLGAKYGVFLSSYNQLAEHIEKLGIEDPGVDTKQRTDYTDFELGVMAIEGSHLLENMGDFHENIARLFYTRRMAGDRHGYSRTRRYDDTVDDLPF